jgi:hypothetical protein
VAVVTAQTDAGSRPASVARRLLIVITFAALTGCGPVAGEAGRFGGTGESTTRYQASSRDVSVGVTLHVDEGQVKFVVIDPETTVRFRSAVLEVGSQYADVLRFPGSAGEWRIVFQLQDAEGTYQVNWGS